MKKVCVVTSTRADWGLLSPVCRAMRDSGRVDVLVVATNMHLIERYGHTVGEIEADGLEIAAKVPTESDGDSDASRSMVMAKTISGITEAFTKLNPDAVLLLGDRYEMLAVAAAAAVMHLPVIHIAGGEVTVGALDDSFRHAITKLSTLHLTATEEYRRRVIQMGEQPAMVVNTGAIGVWNAMNTPVMSAEELSQSVGFDIDSGNPLALVTYHPATNDAVAPTERLENLLAALDSFPQLRLVVTAPNNDAGGEGIFKRLSDYVAQRKDRAVLIPSLGMLRYFSMLHYASMVIGNSSSGIVEVPSAGIPTIDIGMRQQGRIAASSVIHCAEDTSSICRAIERAMTPQMQALAAKKENPYYKPDTLRLMINAILGFLDSMPLPPKTFYDLPL